MHHFKYFAVFLITILAGSLLPACAPEARFAIPAPTSVPPTSHQGQNSATATIILQPTAIPSSTPTPTLTPAASATQPVPEVCSPLEDIPLKDLPGMVNNPFHPPVLGSDDPHQGIDLADRGAGGLAAAGRTVQAVLGGEVAALIRDRFPYGNAIMLETPLNVFPAAWLRALELPAIPPDQEIHTNLTCPPLPEFHTSSQDRSLYLLYAHMQTTAGWQPGEQVSCGQSIGSVGNSGNSINPHLHIEARVGPSGARFESLAHYDASASEQEMSNYCAWRVSGSFALVDPMKVFTIQP
ncbi:MAG: peptidoglycan DD-metalloendopeptidase family protein [Anaerolineales bacterium]|jgi:murein DD-endopeptidase MepM/ murein hydrolase activator NlpD